MENHHGRRARQVKGNESVAPKNLTAMHNQLLGYVVLSNGGRHLGRTVEQWFEKKLGSGIAKRKG